MFLINFSRISKTAIHTTCTISLLGGLSVALSGCGFQEYIAKPLNSAEIAEKFARRQVDNQQFHEFLIANGYQADELPIQQWGADELIYCALFFNPTLDVARAQWRSAEAAKMTAALRPLPNLKGGYGDSNNANDELKPYTYTLSIDLPVETANKRNIRIESAAHLSEAAKLRIAQSAWQLRSEVTKTLFEYQYNQQLLNLLNKEQEYRQQIVAMFQKRISVGESASTELSRANLLLQEVTTQLNEKQRYQLVLQSRLASSLGLPLERITQMPFAQATDAKALALDLSADLQTQALLNRLDIRIALERYAAAEARVKMEIAKQYPDLVFQPNHTYEFGNKIWGLSLSSLMTFLNKNKMPIAEAKQLREVEAAQFEALQNTVIADVATARAKFEQSRQMLDNQEKLVKQQQENTDRIERKFKAGEADRLELTYAKLESLVAQKNYSLANYMQLMSIQDLENMTQAPIMATRLKAEKLEQLTLDNTGK
jgi:cobalt-zinc-cadmium efflux system outer membrane protein